MAIHRSMRRPLRAVVLAALAGVCSVAVSQPVTFAFTGTVTSDPFGLSSFGAPIDGQFTFESAAVDAIPAGSTGSFVSGGPAYGFSTHVDGTAYGVVQTVTVNTANDIGVDQYGVFAEDAGLSLELFFEDATQTALSSDALPSSPPSITAFGFRQFRLFSPDAEFLGTTDSLACVSGCSVVATVPEPSSVLLAGAGLLLLSTLRLRPRRPTRRAPDAANQGVGGRRSDSQP